jgi:hypothetical protein
MMWMFLKYSQMVIGEDRCWFFHVYGEEFFFLNTISKIRDGHYSEHRAACGPYVVQASCGRCNLAHFGYTPLNLTIMSVH